MTVLCVCVCLGLGGDGSEEVHVCNYVGEKKKKERKAENAKRRHSNNCTGLPLPISHLPSATRAQPCRPGQASHTLHHNHNTTTYTICIPVYNHTCTHYLQIAVCSKYVSTDIQLFSTVLYNTVVYIVYSATYWYGRHETSLKYLTRKL